MLRALIGTSVFFMATALFAVAIGALVRNQVAAISIVLLYPLIIESIAYQLLRASDATKDVAKYLPYRAGLGVEQLDQTNTQLPPLAGLAIFLGLTAVLLLLAGTLINRRDA